MNEPKLIIYDLDGTLLDTLQAIADSANHIAQAHGLPTREPAGWKPLVGYGLRHLVEELLETKTDSDVLPAMQAFTQYYEAHADAVIHEYPGITELLRTVAGRGIQQAVLSNKPHLATQRNVADFFPDIEFAAVFGQRDGVATKPDPQAVLEIMTKCAASAEATWFVGDSDTDMQTAINADVVPVAVTWGFRDREELLSYSPAAVYDSANALQQALAGQMSIQ